LQQTANVLRQQGLNRLADDVEDDANRFATDPQSVELEYEAGLAAFTDPQRSQQLTASLRERQANIQALEGGLDEQGRLRSREELTAAQEAAAVDLGLLARATTEAEEFGEREAAKLRAQRKLRPEVEGAVTTAKEAAKDVAAQARERRSNETSFNVYRAAVENLMGSFDKALTGPGFGLIGAVGEDERILEGAIAIMRPTLKQMFRSAGEGTFTDKDQEQLDAMLPNRNDTASVAQAKLQFIDTVVRAKLGFDQPSEGQATPQAIPQQTPQISPQGQRVGRFVVEVE
jgi:hypothetical protein